MNKRRVYKSFKYEDGVFFFPTQYFYDGDCVEIVLCQCFANEDADKEIIFDFNGVQKTVLNRYGKQATIKDIVPRRLYHTWHSTEIEETILLTNSGRY